MALKVEVINELPGYYKIGEWSFDLSEDGNLDEVDHAIECWHAWREFLVRREAAETQEPLF